MTLFVWDNGGEHSDHVIEFIDVDLDPVHTTTLLNAIAEPRKWSGVVVSCIAECNWIQPNRRMTLAEFLVRHDYEVDLVRYRKASLAVFHALPDAFVAEVDRQVSEEYPQRAGWFAAAARAPYDDLYE